MLRGVWQWPPQYDLMNSFFELQKTYLRSKPLQNIACHCIGANALHCGVCRYGFSKIVCRVALATAINLLNSSFSLRRPVMLWWFRIYMVYGTGLHNMMTSFVKTYDAPLEVQKQISFLVNWQAVATFCKHLCVEAFVLVCIAVQIVVRRRRRRWCAVLCCAVVCCAVCMQCKHRTYAFTSD